MNNFVEIFVQHGSENIFVLLFLILVAFIAGILTSLSPCSLGMLPLIIAYVGGYSKNNHKKLFLQLISFSVGLSTVLSIVGIFCALTGKVFSNIASPILILLIASILMILGLSLLEIIELPAPNFIKKIPQNKNGSIFIIPFIVGTVFALVSSPCSTPILASIMTIATISTNTIFAILLLFSYALGQCVIIVLAGVFTSVLKNSQKIIKYTAISMKISGLILIAVAIYLYHQIFSNI